MSSTRHRDGGNNSDTNFGASVNLVVGNHPDPKQPQGNKSYIRFGLDPHPLGFTDAHLQLDVASGGTSLIHVYGLRDDPPSTPAPSGELAWHEDTVTWNNAPQNNSDASGAMLNVGSRVVDLGTKLFSFKSVPSVGDRFTFSNADSLNGSALVDFLNADTNRQVTVVFNTDTETPVVSGAANIGFISKEGITTPASPPFQPPTLFATGTAMRGDANLDGSVNAMDFDILAQHFNQTVFDDFRSGDFNGDGVVNALDFNMLATNFGEPSKASALSSTLVPEPSSILLFASAVVQTRRRRR